MTFASDASLATKQQGQWTLTHVVSESCKCSAKVMAYLKDRGPSSLAHEEIVLLGRIPAESQELVAKGFPLRHLNPENIKEDISKLGVPFLLITTPQGDTVYAGGYSEKSVQDGGPIRDLEILQGLQGKGTVQNFPIFGCAVSRKLQKIVDPFSLKYSKQVNHEL
ncbi:hypothetical protein B9G69_004990 [Bdellovibrio sp. SKB1291214]|uniref:hypothetical protein n=1 Tax=Bdellovibrio sp. SKB1291214 TaxID=1732569 RepID=UPI000B515316|nr:hypothetical protein [Bdellovibrio sp. SKB1291214]UYL09930.1 hypothetical protein B9G69_004990 [Bdellovibrio sp. SKB1291214]